MLPLVAFHIAVEVERFVPSLLLADGSYLLFYIGRNRLRSVMVTVIACACIYVNKVVLYDPFLPARHIVVESPHAYGHPRGFGNTKYRATAGNDLLIVGIDAFAGYQLLRNILPYLPPQALFVLSALLVEADEITRGLFAEDSFLFRHWAIEMFSGAKVMIILNIHKYFRENFEIDLCISSFIMISC
jgi:hypothetical protein